MLLTAAHETDVGRPTPAGGGECPIPSNAGPPTIPWNLRVIVLQGECCRPRRPTLCRAGAPRTPWRTAGPVRGADPSAGEGLPGSDDLVGDKLAVRLSCGTVGISPFGKGPNPQLDEDGWFVAVHPAPALEDVCPVLFYAHSGARRLKVPQDASMDCDVRSQDREMKNGFSAWYEDLSVDGLMFPSDLSQVPDVCVAGPLNTRHEEEPLECPQGVESTGGACVPAAAAALWHCGPLSRHSGGGCFRPRAQRGSIDRAR